MIRLLIGLMVLGGFLIFLGYKEMKLNAGAEDEPQVISAADLIANGPGENKHVRVTDLFMIEKCVYESPDGEDDNYTRLWIPTFTAGEPWIEGYLLESERAQQLGYFDESAVDIPPSFQILVYTNKINSRAEFDRFINRDVVQGMIINEISSITSENLRLLREEYPDLDPDNVLILEYERKPAGKGKVVGFFAGGLLLMLIGPGFFIVARSRDKAPVVPDEPMAA